MNIRQIFVILFPLNECPLLLLIHVVLFFSPKSDLIYSLWQKGIKWTTLFTLHPRDHLHPRKGPFSTFPATGDMWKEWVWSILEEIISQKCSDYSLKVSRESMTGNMFYAYTIKSWTQIYYNHKMKDCFHLPTYSGWDLPLWS